MCAQVISSSYFTRRRIPFILEIYNRFSIYENLGNLLFSFMLGSSLIHVYLISRPFSKHQVILDYSCNLWTLSHYFHLVRPERI